MPVIALAGFLRLPPVQVLVFTLMESQKQLLVEAQSILAAALGVRQYKFVHLY